MRDEDSRKLDYIEKVKVPGGELAIGMFVSELDRPWEETPFLFQGFEITEEADIDTLAHYCRHVYIDSQRTRVLRPAYGAAAPSGGYFRHLPAPRTTAFAKELEVAVTTRAKTSSLVKSFMEEIKFGRSIDVQLARSAVSECVASVTRNPEAMMLLAQIRHKDEYTSEHPSTSASTPSCWGATPACNPTSWRIWVPADCCTTWARCPYRRKCC